MQIRVRPLIKNMATPTTKDLDSLAADVVLGIDQFLLDQKIIDTILDTYKKVCRSDSTRRLDILEKTITDEMVLRLRFECLCFSVFFASLQSSKYLSNQGSIELFADAIAAALVVHSKNAGMSELCEITLVAIEPELTFGFGELVSPLDRLEEYRASFMEAQGSEVEHFGKWIGKALDPPNYPLLEIIGGNFGEILLRLSDVVIAHVFKDRR